VKKGDRLEKRGGADVGNNTRCKRRTVDLVRRKGGQGNGRGMVGGEKKWTIDEKGVLKFARPLDWLLLGKVSSLGKNDRAGGGAIVHWTNGRTDHATGR